MLRSYTYIASPPGTTVCEQVEVCGMSRREFAARMGMSETAAACLLDGETRLTPDIANKLEEVLGLSSSFWSGLEAIYRDKYAKAEAENASRADIL